MATDPSMIVTYRVDAADLTTLWPVGLTGKLARLSDQKHAKKRDWVTAPVGPLFTTVFDALHAQGYIDQSLALGHSEPQIVADIANKMRQILSNGAMIRTDPWAASFANPWATTPVDAPAPPPDAPHEEESMPDTHTADEVTEALTDVEPDRPVTALAWPAYHEISTPEECYPPEDVIVEDAPAEAAETPQEALDVPESAPSWASIPSEPYFVVEYLLASADDTAHAYLPQSEMGEGWDIPTAFFFLTGMDEQRIVSFDPTPPAPPTPVDAPAPSQEALDVPTPADDTPAPQQPVQQSMMRPSGSRLDVRVLKENLLPALKAVAPAAAKPVGKKDVALPVLACIRLFSDGGRLGLAASDLNVGITSSCGAQVRSEGGVCIHAKSLVEVIDAQTEALLSIAVTEDGDVIIAGLNGERLVAPFTLAGIHDEEFPTLPTPADESLVGLLSMKVVGPHLKRIAIAVAEDDAKPVLHGMLMQSKGSTVLRLAGADGFVAGVSDVALSPPLERDFAQIVPRSTVLHLIRLLKPEGAISVYVMRDGTQIGFLVENTLLVSRTIDGTYPDLDRILPISHTSHSLLKRDDLAHAIKRAALVAGDNQNLVKLTSGGIFGITASAPGGTKKDITDTLTALASGETITIALNVKYVSDMLAAMTGDSVSLALQSPISPAVFTEVGLDGFRYVIMPMPLR